MDSTWTPDHHGSHRKLLWSADESSAPQGQRIDAIIVPTARHPAWLAGSATLAVALGCPLLTLHTKPWTSAAKAARQLPPSVDLIAIDLSDRYQEQLRLPDWGTSRLLAKTVFKRRTDVSAKRNVALLLSRMLGWKRVLFLDDDITRLRPEDVRRASGLLNTHNAVGLHVGGFPDNSVVCHAYRQAGGNQKSFIGAGALAVHVDRNMSFFPDIYNDDWFFLLDGDKGIQSTAVTGEVRQLRYDPFRTPDRARAEELGDVLAEGIYWLLDQERSIPDADPEHWRRFLERRKKFVEHVLEMVQQDLTIERAEQARRIAALKGSLGRLALITPELCDGYLRAWMADRQSWHKHLQKLPTRQMLQLPAGKRRGPAVATLTRPGVTSLTWRTGTSASAPALPAEPPPDIVQDDSAVPELTAVGASDGIASFAPG